MSAATETYVNTPNRRELIEAAVRSGKAERATAATRAVGGGHIDWRRRLGDRNRAPLPRAGERGRERRAPLSRGARSTEPHPSWLAHICSTASGCAAERRQGDARAELRGAHEQFTASGMEAFAERGRRDLLATGEHVRKRTVKTRDDLTAQERQIAGLALDGLSNQEIGARLFLSQHTVAYHVRKVAGKHGISSRRELAAALPGSEPESVPA